MPSVVVATWEIMKEHGTRVFQNTAIRKFDPTPLLGQIKEETNDSSWQEQKVRANYT